MDHSLWICHRSSVGHRMLDTLIVEDPQSCVGLEVLLQDLVGRAELNGRSGIAVSFDTKTCSRDRMELVHRAECANGRVRQRMRATRL